MRLQRNHGLMDRDNVEVMGCNSRLDTFQRRGTGASQTVS